MARNGTPDDPELVARAISMRADGATYAQIKSTLGVGSDTVGRLLGTTGRGGARPRVSPDVRELARNLRLDGSTVPEIASQLGVARSTAWMLVRDLLPAPGFNARERRAEAGRAYWRKERPRRMAERQSAVDTASLRVGDLSERELMLIGAVAYWAEGTKSKPWRRQDRLTFTNSDPEMIKLFIAWLGLLRVTSDRIKYRVSIHETADVDAAIRYWADVVGVAVDSFARTTLKRHQPMTQRHNAGADYYGCLVVRVNGSAGEYRLTEGLWRGLSAALSRMHSVGPAS